MDLLSRKWSELKIEDAVLWCRPFTDGFRETAARLRAAYRAEHPEIKDEDTIPSADAERLAIEGWIQGGLVGGWSGFTSGDSSIPDVAPGALSEADHANAHTILSHPDIYMLFLRFATKITREYYRLEEDATGN